MRLFPLLSLVGLLTATLAVAGCSEAPSSVKSGPLFVAAEKAPSSQAQVYVYWPAEEQDGWDTLSVMSCEGAFETLHPGGYAKVLVSPGQQCFQLERLWNLESGTTSVGMDLASLDLDVVAGQTLFVRLEKGQGRIFSGMTLRSVEPARAEPQIKKCGKMIPLADEELIKAWKAARND